MKAHRLGSFLLAFLLLSLFLVSATGRGGMTVQAHDLMEDIIPENKEGLEIDKSFLQSFSDFSVKLFKEAREEGQNALISPFSVMMALAMTANGAGGQTLTQMEELFGCDLASLNRYLLSCCERLKGDQLKIADSIWFRNTLPVKKSFLQVNADFYKAAAYASPFDETTLSDINYWVEKNTDGMIEKLLDELDTDAQMILINALTFDAKWKTKYESDAISKQYFTALNGEKTKVSFQKSTESLYISTEQATGFLKPYDGEKFSFLALLPNEGVDFEEYLSSLTGESLLSAIRSAQPLMVEANIPQFETEYSSELSAPLKNLGMMDAFGNSADFSGISEADKLFISQVLHKTAFSLDDQGTKAAAVTGVFLNMEMAPVQIPPDRIVTLDRPFVYAIVDTQTGLPLFLGTLTDI